MAIKRIHISPSWVFQDDSGQRVDPQLFKLLAALHQTRKLTAAAKAIGVSYRHSWNLLNRWSDFFGSELANLERGRGASLTALGEKLLWAEQRAVARFEPQMDNLASELNGEIHRLLEQAGPLLRIHASHGYAVALLPAFCRDFELDLQYKSPTEALSALNHGLCDIAGFHLPAEVKIATLLENYPRHLNADQHCIVRFITRKMGLHVAAGNPKAITGIGDLVRADLSFINRNSQSGSRALLDQLLADAGIDHRAVNGYQSEEFTHSAVAAHVASGMADTGFGVEAAARQFGLDFVPVTNDNYLLVCHREHLQTPLIKQFLALLGSDEFSQAVAQIPGYSAGQCGRIESLETVFNPH